MATEPGTKRPTSDLVIVGWLRSRVAELATKAATSLPTDRTKITDGFAVVSTIGRAAEAELVELRHGYAQVDVYAAPPVGSDAVPWHITADLAELIHAATAGNSGGDAPLAASFMPARVLSIYTAVEPEKVEGDPSGYARHRIDLAFEWSLA